MQAYIYIFNYSFDLFACLKCIIFSLKDPLFGSRIVQFISNNVLGMEKTKAGVQLFANKVDSGSQNEIQNPFSS